MRSKTSKTYRSLGRVVTEEAAWAEGLRIIGFFKSVAECYPPPTGEEEKRYFVRTSEKQ
jgi:hypothetical protein